MTNQEILKIALQQSAYDCNCNPEDFLSTENKIVLSQKNEKARVYMPLPLECDLVSYGNSIVAQVSLRMKETVEWYIGKFSVEHCFESPNVIALNEKLAQFGYKVCFMAEYFLPDVNELKELPCDYATLCVKAESTLINLLLVLLIMVNLSVLQAVLQIAKQCIRLVLMFCLNTEETV